MKPGIPLPLSRTERIVAVVPEYCNGPGWANSPLWVYIANHADNTMRSEAIQPEEQTVEQRTLFRIGADVHAALMSSVATKKSKS